MSYLNSNTRTGQKRNLQNAVTPRLDPVVTFKKGRPKSFTNRISVHQSSTVYETDSPAHWNTIGRTKTALPVVISLSCILRFHSFPQKISGARFKRFILSFFFYFLKTELSLQLSNSRSAGVS